MAFPPGDFLRITVRGNITGGESWSFTHYQQVTGLVALPAPADLQTLCNSCEAAAATMWNTLKTKCSAETSFTGLNLAFIRNGVTAFSNQTNEVSAIPGTAAAHMPVYISRVVSLLTSRAGKSYRGRMYLPYNGLVFVPGAVLWPSDSTTLAAVKAFLLACTADILVLPSSVTAGPVIYSKTASVATPVTQIRMDNKPDTQRGRERSIAATIFDTLSIP
jgi:hypothetical protein